ncbi:unnamed protein product [Rotaria sordida]|uniref:Uncharacterized protein n=1 Tax=Rotaria sordida TaxID=392033 RepID=A0A815ST89_9BILA|nr:unnamed protein product [Rotaria sordida]CAF1494488.1 unnamed protein product [Rotaria sordida]
MLLNHKHFHVNDNNNISTSIPSKSSSLSSSLLIIVIIIIAMIGLFISIISFLIYRYHKNQRHYLKTLTRTIYDTLQNSSYNITIPTSY